MTFEVTVEPWSAPYEAMAATIGDREALTLSITPPWTEYLFEPGDKVRVPFDRGMGPAEIVSAGGTFVTVKYGPGGKYRTSLYRTSVQTEHKIEHPAVVTMTPETETTG